MAPMNYQAEQVKRETPAVKESTSNNNTNNGNGVGNVYLDNYKVGFVQKSAASQIFGG
jgi:hypothetical protein